MAPRSPLSIATQALQRLIKEELSYHREVEQQKERIERLQAGSVLADDYGNRDYVMKQEIQALKETKNVLPDLRRKISEALAKLERLLTEEGSKGPAGNVEEMNAAEKVVANAKATVREIS
ncbi:hypothetical protein KEM55_003679 [Ascosphaera atra]|nr:hypothetical protein KEM55_003679 [Ascosphaera atra]